MNPFYLSSSSSSVLLWYHHHHHHHHHHRCRIVVIICIIIIASMIIPMTMTISTTTSSTCSMMMMNYSRKSKFLLLQNIKCCYNNNNNNMYYYHHHRHSLQQQRFSYHQITRIRQRRLLLTSSSSSSSLLPFAFVPSLTHTTTTTSSVRSSSTTTAPRNMNSRYDTKNQYQHHHQQHQLYKNNHYEYNNNYHNNNDNYYFNNNNVYYMQNSYPLLSFGGLQLSSTISPLLASTSNYETVVWEEDDDDSNESNSNYNNDNKSNATTTVNLQQRVEQQEQQLRPHPPTLMDETSYYGGYYGTADIQYDTDMDTLLLYDDTTDPNSSTSLEKEMKKPFVPIQNTKLSSNSGSVTSKQIKYSSNNMYDDDDTTITKNSKQRSYYSPYNMDNNNKKQQQQQVIRPPVKVSIPSQKTYHPSSVNTKTTSFMDVDLSMYDTTFDTDNDNYSNDDTSNTVVEEEVVVTKKEVYTNKVYNKTDVHNNVTTRKQVSMSSSSSSSSSMLPKNNTRSSDISLIPSTHFHVGQTLTELPGYDPSIDEYLSKAAHGVGITTSIDVLSEELAKTEQYIYEINNNIVFNINSPKQVAIAIFGTDSSSSTNNNNNVSTNKDVLEIMAGNGHTMAKLILQYRSIKYKMTKLIRQETNRNKGTAVRSALTVARPKTENRIINNDESVVKEPSQKRMSNIIADPILLLDASAFIFRAYFSMPPLHRNDGMPIGAVMGFCKMLNSLILHRMLEGEQPRLVLCFDAKGKTFRHDIYEQYKANRPPAPMDLVPQFDLVRQAAKAYGICQIEAIHFEADDVIATLACKAIEEGVDANILSGDKDLMQLVTDYNITPSIQIIDPMKKERTTYQEVIDKWQVPPNKLGDVLALAGDTADNVPGVRGIGAVTAAKLINEYGSLDNVLQSIDTIKQKGLREKLQNDKANAILSRTLVELNRTVPMNELLGLPNGTQQKISDLRMEVMDPDRILEFYEQMGFKELKTTFQKKIQGLQIKRKKGSSYKKRPKARIPIPDDYSDVPF